MSTQSGFSSYSMASQAKVTQQKLEIEKLRRENAEMKKAQAQAQAQAQTQTQALTQPNPSTSSGACYTPGGRKRRYSQQLERSAKDIKVTNCSNRFGALAKPNSNGDTHEREMNDFIKEQITKSRSYAEAVNNQAASITRADVLNHQGAPNARVQPGQAVIEPSSEILTQQPRTTENQPQIDGLVEGIFDVKNNGAMREEIEVAIETLNGNPFRGTLTYIEAKQGIFGGCLGFPDYENFDGVRLGFRGCPVAIFKLKTAINVDELLPLQSFNFTRRFTREGTEYTDTFSCKIRGLRPPNNKNQASMHGRAPDIDLDDGTRSITIEGCDYRVPKETLVRFLTCYGEVLTDVLELVFNDGDTGGSNRTGSYSVNVRLNQELPQLAPIAGKRVKFYYRGIQKLCSKCFGNHHVKSCHSKKKLWLDYVESFMLSNQDIPREVYGKWVEIMDKTQRQVPLSLLQPNRQVESGMEPDVQAKPISAARVEVEGIVEAPAPAHVEVHENVKANEWLTVNSKSGGTTQKSDQTTKAPTEQDFKVPRNETEHNEMVTRLTDGGSTPTEAEQIIAARKSAFNKASKQFKKNMVKPTKWNQRKANQSRKSAINPTIDHGY